MITIQKRCLPLHDEESVRHVVLVTLCLVQLLGQHVIHCALQEVWHFYVPVPVKHAVQSLTTATETVHRERCNTQSENIWKYRRHLRCALCQKDERRNIALFV